MSLETHLDNTTKQSKLGFHLFCCSFSYIKLVFAYSQYPSIIKTFPEMGPCLTLSPPYANERSLEARNEVIVQPFLAEGVWYLGAPRPPPPPNG